MKFYIDIKQNIAWLTAFRNGSTTLRVLSEKFYKDLIPYEIGDRNFFTYLNDHPGMPIFIVFRDPEVRFRSGLVVNSPNGYYTTQLNYKKWIVSQKEVLNNLNLYQQGKSYHLFDPHLDHILWAPALLSSYGYNVKLIPMNHYTDLLLDKYSTIYLDCKQYCKTNKISESDPSSFNESRLESSILWSIYKEIMINDDLSYTFDDWMSLEKKIFDIYNNISIRENFNNFSKDIMSELLSDSHYFKDIQSPRVNQIYRFIHRLHQYNPPINDIEKIKDNQITEDSWKLLDTFRDTVRDHYNTNQ